MLDQPLPDRRGGAPQLRCAVYTRKSSEEGLEQAFNSLEAQREACENYIKSQAQEGWVLIPGHFDDGGFSGGNVDRPGLRQLMEMVRDRKVDTIVVYKIDRLTRSLADFAKLADSFETHGVSFVSVTQQFNTTTSMGRLMLNVLLSFAQFEREVTGERIRDKFAASKRRGMWMGGPVPLGYDVKDRNLVINEPEASRVRRIFELYLERGNVRLVEEELRRLGLRTKRTVTRNGRTVGDQSFSRGHLYKILGNPLYVGDISHKGERHKGQHDAIIDKAIWNEVQAVLGDNTQGEQRRRRNTKEPTLLAGLLVDEFGNTLTSTHAVKDGKRYRYYSSKASAARGAHNRPVSDYRIPATEIEPAVIREIVAFLNDPLRLTAALGIDAAEPGVIVNVLASAKALADELASALPSRQRVMLEKMVSLVGLSGRELRVELNDEFVGERLLGGRDRLNRHAVLIATTFRVALRGVESRLIVDAPNGARRGNAPDRTLVRAIACGRAWFEELAGGRAASFGEIAARVGVTDRYVSRIVDLAFLSPDVVEAILNGEHRPDVTIKRLTVDGQLPTAWEDQQRAVCMS